MHKLFWVDISLIFLTILGCGYLYNNNYISLSYAIFILFIYICSKIIGYIILPYNKFETFIDFLTDSSKIGKLSGFELFKTTLVSLLYIGFIFINPAIWIIESILVIMMRIWGYFYIKGSL